MMVGKAKESLLHAHTIILHILHHPCVGPYFCVF